jgi:hypothetical protein
MALRQEQMKTKLGKLGQPLTHHDHDFDELHNDSLGNDQTIDML